MAPSTWSTSAAVPSAPGLPSRRARSLLPPTVAVVAVVLAGLLAAVGAVLFAVSTGDLDRAGLRAGHGRLDHRRLRPGRPDRVAAAAGEPLRAVADRRGIRDGRDHLAVEPQPARSTRSGSSSTCCRRWCSRTSSSPFPTGRLVRGRERLLVGVGYVTAVGASLLVLRPRRVRSPQPARADLAPGAGGSGPERATAGSRRREPPRGPAAQPWPQGRPGTRPRRLPRPARGLVLARPDHLRGAARRGRLRPPRLRAAAPGDVRRPRAGAGRVPRRAARRAAGEVRGGRPAGRAPASTRRRTCAIRSRAPCATRP